MVFGFRAKGRCSGPRQGPSQSGKEDGNSISFWSTKKSHRKDLVQKGLVGPNLELHLLGPVTIVKKKKKNLEFTG